MSLSDNLDDNKESCAHGSSKFDDRDIILSKLNEAIDYLHNKSMKGRITNEKNEKVRIAWFKALAYACSIYNQIKRDVELDELKEEIETLKEHIKSLDEAPKSSEEDGFYD